MAGNMTSVKNDWDANNLVINGSYYITGGENIPEPYFYIVVLRAASSPDFVQYGIGVSSSTMYVRTFANNEWSSWTRLDNFGYYTLEGLATALKPLLGL